MDIINIIWDKYTYKSILSNRDEGPIYIYTNTETNKDVVVKTRINNKECLLREYNVGIQLNKLQSPHFLQTLHHYETDNTFIIILEYIDGETLDTFYENNKMIDGFHITMHCIYFLLHLSNIIKFTHYDLHPQNIIIKKLPHPQTFLYNVFGKEISFTSNLLPVIIDYGTSYLDNIGGWSEVHVGHLFNGIVPNVYDDLIDISTIICYFFLYYTHYHHIEDLLVRNKIALKQIKNIAIQNYTFPGRQLTYWINLFYFKYHKNKEHRTFYNGFYNKFYIKDSIETKTFEDFDKYIDLYIEGKGGSITGAYELMSDVLGSLKIKSMKNRYVSVQEIFEKLESEYRKVK